MVVLPSIATSTDLSPEDDCEEAARRLEATGRFRVLRKLVPRPLIPNASVTPRAGRRTGIVVDTETTGLDVASDEIIELAMVKFTFDSRGIHDIVARFEALQQPSRPLSSSIARLTGLDDRMLAGAEIDEEAVAAFAASADLVIAHNARFDRPFCEKHFPAFRSKRWACSATEIDWRRLGVEGAKLGYILASFGRFHSGHRALADCDALLEVLGAPPPAGGQAAFVHLVASSDRTTVEIVAKGAPFQAKDVLKARGYRWNNGSGNSEKGWFTIVSEDHFADEVEFLRNSIFGRAVDLPVRRLTALDRYR